MSYKSYAQAGQYGTYHIDLPIKAEINEDLRAAGDFAKQMERSQNYREKWAGSYLSALNKKSGIERQNRDDNFEFLQKNFKAIYEGEQREFEGRLAELKREQAEAANADPGFWDDLLPSLIEVAPKIMGMVAAGQAAQAEEFKMKSEVVLNNIGSKATAALPSVKKAYLAADGDKIAQERIFNEWKKTFKVAPDGRPYNDTHIHEMLKRGGDMGQAFNNIALDNAQRLTIEILNNQFLPGQPGHASNFATPQEQSNWATNQYDTVFSQVSKGYEFNSPNTLANFETRDQFVAGISKQQYSTHVARAKEQVAFRNTSDISAAIRQKDQGAALLNAFQIFHTRGQTVEDYTNALKANQAVTPEHVQYVIDGLKKRSGLPMDTKPGGFGPNINALVEYRNELLDTQQRQIRQSNQDLRSNQTAGYGHIMNQLGSLTTQGERLRYLNEALQNKGQNALNPEQIKKLQMFAANPDELRKHFNPSFNVKHKLSDPLIISEITSAFGATLNQGPGGQQVPWQKRAPRLLAEAKSAFPIYFEQVLRDNPGMSKEMAVGVAAQELADKYLASGRLKLDNVPGSANYDPTKPIGTNYDSDRTPHSQTGSAAQFVKTIEAGKKDNPQTLEIDFYEQFPNSGLMEKYRNLNSLVSLIQTNNGTMIQSDIALMNDPQITILTQTTGHSRSQIIDWQGKVLLGKDWVGLPADLVATDAELREAGGLARRFMKEQTMRTTESAQFIKTTKAIRSGNRSGYPLNSYARTPWNPPNPAEAHRIGTTGVPTGHKDYKGHNIVMQTPELASLARELLDAYPGLAGEVQRSQQTAAYNASVPGSSTTSNHLANGGHGALDLAGPKADALAANPTGEAANWIWEWHNHHWHIEPKRGN